uniref:Uncharacterized protein n=1 Tax=Oryza sativa subsp. japonica TaxID=39947 RepID=Q6Z346_ORYSJ|nr:hypothetical protein [Oryza sativa Japonica Group]
MAVPVAGSGEAATPAGGALSALALVFEVGVMACIAPEVVLSDGAGSRCKEYAVSAKIVEVEECQCFPDCHFSSVKIMMPNLS